MADRCPALTLLINQRGFFGTPRGLGLATATTSAAFFPHLEQRIRVARAASVTDLPPMRANASRGGSKVVPT
jgi:hypothetical protein